MTETNNNNFEQRADVAAGKLKGMISRDLSRRFGKEVELPETKVEVGPDGRSPAAPPPEGSYAAMAQQQHQEEGAPPTPEPQPQQVQEPEPVAPTPELQRQDQAPDISDNANTRIRGLVAQLREKDRELQALQSRTSSTASTIEELEQKYEALSSAHSKLIEQNLEVLDPETRAAVMADARMGEAIQASERRILALLGPEIRAIKEREDQQELANVAHKYPGFDYEIHPTLIDQYRTRNPASTVEMAFRAVADDAALGIGSSPRVAVPPVVEPGSGAGTPRSIPTAEQQSDPVEEMREEARMAADLARSNNPQDYKKALRAFDKNIGDRIFGGR
jgi:hypothetical protein